MTYPNYPNKHLHESLVNPDHLKNNNLPKNLPKKYIIIYDRRLTNYIVRKYKAKKIPKLSKHAFDFYWYKDIGFIKMKGIGGPNAVASIEELIIHGGKTFLNIGMAGGLHKQGIFLCKKALRDEGTSYHYIPDGKFSYPDENLTKKLGKYIEKQGLEFFEGTTWTIDAPYRETKKEVEHYAKKGISTVEMEASALFAVAKYRKVKIASAFVVSDILHPEKWEPKFDNYHIRRNINRLFDAAVECLK